MQEEEARVRLAEEERRRETQEVLVQPAPGTIPLSVPPTGLPAREVVGIPTFQLRPRWRKVPLSILLTALLVIAGGILNYYVNMTHQISMNQAPATVTVSAQAPNPYGGKLVISDPMSGPGSAFGWKTGNDTLGDQCNFKDNAYHVVRICDSNGIMNGKTNGNASISMKFAFEIHLNAGENCGELHFYFQSQLATVPVDICQNGQYQLRGNPEVDGTASAMHTGAGQFNTIGIVADDTHMGLYINYVLVATSSSAYTGVFGLKLDGYGNVGNGGNLLGEVVYTDARLWSF